MDRKKDMILSVAGLLIVAIGSVVLLIMDFPAGLLAVLPSAVPHIIRLWNMKKNRNAE